MSTDQYGVTVQRDVAHAQPTSARDLPSGYRITREYGAYTLYQGRRVVRTSSTREALVAWLTEGK